MPPSNFQHFLDQNFAAVFPIFFLTLWLSISAVISFIGGWFALSKLYRASAPFNGFKRKMQSGQMRRFTNYNNVLTLGANREGLYLACMFLFRFMHPPLLIPWTDVKVQRSKGWFFKYVTFTMGREIAISLRTRAKLADELRNQAGSDWPVEEMQSIRSPLAAAISGGTRGRFELAFSRICAGVPAPPYRL